MRKFLFGFAALALVAPLGTAPTSAEDTIKNGIIMPYSGQFADASAQSQRHAELGCDALRDCVQRHAAKSWAVTAISVFPLSLDLVELGARPSELVVEEPHARSAWPKVKMLLLRRYPITVGPEIT